MDSQTGEIKAKIDIYSLVSQYVDLKKAGKNYKGLCPFHGEKSPSFMVNPERNIFKCFGCDKGGDIFTFLEEIEGVSFSEALKILAKRSGVTLQHVEVSPEEKEKEIYLAINAKATEFYNYLLEKHQVGEDARKYLKNRNVKDDTIREFSLGFAPRQRDVLSQFLLKKKYDSRQLITAGVSLPDGRGLKDRFYQRILFPIKNPQGQVVGFSGRILGEGEPKYLNSPDSPIFNKSKLLFGIDIAKTEAKKAGEIILVEGNFDVILSHQVGVKNVVAPLGTGLGESQISLIKRFTDTISFCFDTDRAGQAATMRGIELAENAGVSVNIITVKEAKDAAELITSKPQEWKKLITEKTPVLDFYLDTFINRFDAQTAEGKRKIGNNYLPILGRIEDPLIRTHYLQKMAALLQLDEEEVFGSISRFLPGNRPEMKHTPEQLPAVIKNQVEKYLLALILQSQHVPKNLKDTTFRDVTFDSIKKVLEVSASGKMDKLDVDAVLEKLTETEKAVASDLLLLDIGSEILLDEEKIISEINSCINRLQEVNLRLNLKKLAIEVKQAEAAADKEKLTDLNKKFRDLSLKLTSLGGK